VWLTSDNHFGHKNIIGYCDRPYKSVEEMNENMIENWNAVVSPNDQVIVVGDFSFMDLEETKAICRRLYGIKTLVRGNHDKAHSDIWFQKAGFDTVTEHIVLPSYKTLESAEVQHHPVYETRYGLDILFHGHAHNYCLAKHYVTKNKVLLNVGVDCWGFRPIHIDQAFDAVERIRQQFNEEGKTLWKVGEL